MSNPDSVPLGEAAYLRLRADIVSCRLAPGARLTERGLAAETGFGVSPIRDALTRLDHEGLIRTLPRKGYQVKPLTIKVVDDLFEFWALIGPEVARRGVPRCSAEQVDRIIAIGEEFTKLTDDDSDPRLAIERSPEIFDAIFAVLTEATGNEYLFNACSRLSGELARVWTLVIDSELMDYTDHLLRLDNWKDDVVRRDGDKVAQLAERYIEQYHNRVLRTLVRWPSVVTSEVVPLPQGAVPNGPSS